MSNYNGFELELATEDEEAWASDNWEYLLSVSDAEDRKAYAEKVSVRNNAACHGCQWLTGEKALPCAVNPLAFRQGCYDYEV